MWILESTGVASTTFTFRILPGTMKNMGRAPGADFVVDAALVSRLHCRLTVDPDDRLHVEDLDSTNGTWVNGRKVARAPLQAGDLLKVGRVEFEVKDGSRVPSDGSDTV